MSSKHYYQGGYDYDFVEELDRKYECPICLLCLRDPHQTSCGHRFCYSCILTWLGEGKTCPDDNCSLGEGDIYADTGINREILQLKIRCTNCAGECKAEVKVCELAAHLRTCTKMEAAAMVESSTCPSCGELMDLESNHSNIICPRAQVACPFASVGCLQRIQRYKLQEHVKTQTSHHMQLIAEKLLKVQQLQSAVDYAEEPVCASALNWDGERSSLPGSPTLSRDSGVRGSGSNIHNNTKLIRESYQRLIQMEQRQCQLQIRLDHLESLLKQPGHDEEEMKGKFCNGNFVWKISDFSLHYEKMRSAHSFVIYSRPFYSSVYGYKMCLRCNISVVNNEEHLGLFFHLMKGENDDCLMWPFSGTVTLTVFNQGQGLHREHLTEHLEAVPNLGAFQRPAQPRNLRGFGFQEFVRTNALYSGGFIQDNKLVVKALVLPNSIM